MACALAATGANVHCSTRTWRAVPSCSSGWVRTPAAPPVIETDVLDPASVTRALDALVERYGKVDVLINGAGGNHPKATTNADMKFFDLPADALRWVFDLNLIGTIIPSQVFGRRMHKRAWEHPEHFVDERLPAPDTHRRLFGGQGGVSNFTQWLAVHMAQEYSPRIRVNAIAPGFFLTDQNRFC